jgi:hypothetical protein
MKCVYHCAVQTLSPGRLQELYWSSNRTLGPRSLELLSWRIRLKRNFPEKLGNFPCHRMSPCFASSFVILLTFPLVLRFCNCTTNNTAVISDQKICHRLYRTYTVKPGINWGTLPGMLLLLLLLLHGSTTLLFNHLLTFSLSEETNSLA